MSSMSSRVAPRGWRRDPAFARRRRVLLCALAINLCMFGVETTGGIHAGSAALLADSLDMLGDAFVYGLSLMALGRGRRWGARAALSKAGLMLVLGLGVLARAILGLHSGMPPQAPPMAAIALLALLANAACVGLLWSDRRGSLDLRSSWLCSRNDLLGNAAILGAAGPTAWLGSPWPDAIVAFALAGLLVSTAGRLLRASLAELATDRRLSPWTRVRTLG
ncbi:MAG: cation transporter [bacterium]